MQTSRRELALVVGGTALIGATYGLARFGYGLFLPEIRRDVAVGATAAGLVQAGGFVSYCLAAVVAVRAGSRPRALVGCAVLAAGLGSLGVALAGGVVTLAVAVFVAGAGAGFASPGLVALLARGVAPTRQDDAQVVVNAGTGVGIVGAAGLLLAVGSPWRVGWVVVALVVALAGAAVLLADRPGPRPRRPGPAQAATTPLLAGLARPVLAAVLAGASSAATWTFGPTLLADAGGGADPVVAWTALGAGGVLGALAARLSDRWSIEVAWLLTAAAAGLATGVLGLGAAHPVLAHLSAAVFGATYTALSGVLILWARRGSAARGSERTAVLFVALALGQAAGAAALGAVTSVVPVGTAFVVAGGVGVVAGSVSVLGSPHRRRRALPRAPGVRP